MLTDKQKIFIKEYLVDMNASAAYQRAGYKARGGSADTAGARLLRNVQIKAEIDKALNKRANKVGLDAEWVLRRFKDISDRCMQAEAMLDTKGEPTGEYRFDSSGANKATEMIGKHLGMFTDKVEHSGEMEIIKVTLTDD